jgi:hypothetical protein
MAPRRPTAVWCVRHHNGWCATLRSAKPSSDALLDATACGHVVILRLGSERRMPSCPDCIKAIARRTAAAT